ncbi:unnamed protein product [Dovyalis caffra]|uniref:Uncharacterized protein n=1 Tax=Dovyalis caffra TaxID=77055 RepID=A0AAV1SER9_9ROSI|nr:unnamed protein product [Dovyalis caffra]
MKKKKVFIVFRTYWLLLSIHLCFTSSPTEHVSALRSAQISSHHIIGNANVEIKDISNQLMIGAGAEGGNGAAFGSFDQTVLMVALEVLWVWNLENFP